MINSLSDLTYSYIYCKPENLIKNKTINYKDYYNKYISTKTTYCEMEFENEP